MPHGRGWCSHAHTGAWDRLSAMHPACLCCNAANRVLKSARFFYCGPGR
nr:MAG TPA: hypothetical protein [Caudoviricetes sp.]